MSLTFQKRIDAFIKLGRLLTAPNEELKQVAASAQHHNGWFTAESVAHALSALGHMLSAEIVYKWASAYGVPDEREPKKIGLVLAGNIPLVGFHDVLCVLISGHHAQIRLSSADDQLIPYVLKKLTEIEPAFENRFELTDRLAGFDAVIATGSNNTARYFEYYFGKVPNIIRKSRTSVAVLTDDTTPQEIEKLGHDLFDYFGLGCRNVSRLFLPVNFLIERLFAPLEPFSQVLYQHKYNNNYDYQKSILLVNRVPHFDNGFVLLREDTALVSPPSVLYYERYRHISEAENYLAKNSNHIQCVVCGTRLQVPIPVVGFGESQQPGPGDYADNVDTMAFLASL